MGLLLPIGAEIPGHATANGKVLLAFNKPKYLRKYAGRELPALYMADVVYGYGRLSANTLRM